MLETRPSYRLFMCSCGTIAEMHIEMKHAKQNWDYSLSHHAIQRSKFCNGFSEPLHPYCGCLLQHRWYQRLWWTKKFISHFKSNVSYKSVAYRIKHAIFNEVKLSSRSSSNIFFNITGQDRLTKSYAFKLCTSPSARTQEKQTNKQSN